MLQPGLLLGGRYLLVARVGAGGMGEVWRATDEVLGRTVAVKVMLPEVAGQAGFARRFVAEAQAMAGVSHPGVANIHDYGQDHGVTFMVMEFIDGESLAQAVARAGRMAPPEVMRMIAEAAEGLQAVHDAGIVHRDVKPANLLVRRNGQVVLTDFGISRAGDSTGLTQSGAVLGTPTYLSPEQVLGQPATPLSDLYALGVAAYEMLAGRRPFVGENAYAVALQRVQAPPPPLPADVPPNVAAVVGRMLATDPAQRWPSASTLAEVARAAAGGALMPAAPFPGPHPPWPAAPPKRRRSPVIVAVAVAAVAVLAAGFAVVKLAGDRDARAEAGSSGGTVKDRVPDHFKQCDQGFCPVEEMCWGGLVGLSGRAEMPRKAPCAQEHYWETFAAIEPPPGSLEGNQTDLITTDAAVKKACTRAVMEARAKDKAKVKGWTIGAWPMQFSGTTDTLIHCLANSGQGEVKASVFAIS
ncbi:serine/threonine-protein kinase [Actinoplanes sp. NPDC089786]|uniref:serine/threonine-protein kinase n=1 Tax=Actinoplanes sp. NPDC089786 TaxID=3155185 RepID=UPI0034269AC7